MDPAEARRLRILEKLNKKYKDMPEEQKQEDIPLKTENEPVKVP
jgi:hypothetical protein